VLNGQRSASRFSLRDSRTLTGPETVGITPASAPEAARTSDIGADQAAAGFTLPELRTGRPAWPWPWSASAAMI
jgi:hypothetical protein